MKSSRSLNDRLKALTPATAYAIHLFNGTFSPHKICDVKFNHIYCAHVSAHTRHSDGKRRRRADESERRFSISIITSQFFYEFPVVLRAKRVKFKAGNVLGEVRLIRRMKFKRKHPHTRAPRRHTVNLIMNISRKAWICKPEEVSSFMNIVQTFTMCAVVLLQLHENFTEMS